MSETERPEIRSSPDDHEHHRDDVRAEPLEERGRGPVQGLPHAAAVMGKEVRIEEVLAHPVRAEARGLRRESEQQPAGDGHHPDRHGSGRGQEGAHDQGDPGEPEGDRDDDRPRSHRVGEGRLRAVADRSPVPAEVEDVAEVDRQPDAAQAGEVEAALHHLGRPAALATRTSTRRRLSLSPARRLLLAPGRIAPLRSPKNPVCKHAPTHSTPGAAALPGTNARPKAFLKVAWEA